MNAGEVSEVLGTKLLSGYAQFIVEPALGCQSDSHGIVLVAFLLNLVERMTAAGIGVGIWKSYLGNEIGYYP